jgi:hypothetical protein
MNQPLAEFNIGTSFQDLVTTLLHSIPKIVVFLAILIIGWIVAKALMRIVDMILRRVKFDHFVERGAVGAALARSNTDATSLIAKIVYYAVMLIALQMAFGVWGQNPISSMLNGIVAWLPRAVVAIIIIVIASAIARVVKDLINGAIGGLSYGPFVASVASVIIIALGVIAALNQVGIAAAVTQPVLYAVLLTAGAIVAIGVGGGLVKPMQARWERMLTAAERETTTQVAAYQQGRTDAMSAPQAPAGTRQTAGQSARPPQPGQPPYQQGQGGYPQNPGQGSQGGQTGQTGQGGPGYPRNSDQGDWRDPGPTYYR